MVSNSLNLELQELLELLAEMKRDFATDSEYQALRSSLPEDWPL